MKELTLISWNVNGIRAVSKKEVFEKLKFNDWLHKVSPDFLSLQETKAHPEQLTGKLLNPQGYLSNWSSAERKGYSGVVTYSKVKPIRVNTKLTVERLNNEGRLIETEFPDFVLLNVYFPNGKLNAERLKYKMDFYEVFLEHVIDLKKQGKSVIICGDVNTAHKEIDLTHPKSNEDTSGFLPKEREWIDKLVSSGFIDSFRYFNKKPEHYTWWSVRNIGARERNVGWRIDYFFVSEDLIEKVTESSMLSDVLGSDHCPLILKLKL
ncbi:MAG: exodeoxyribonuclease III [Candidatus Heimdallarchaeota archaeon]|nr:exodeoxyribonuclease III [Candidatus Heimdallarchaeota archaeon]MCG3255530.1 exodeoxyribonuclease III [Candidatus Heimdallarchaeota archaeon]MCK4610605.1 exodeoxyribonuclease III [Candidatus Heimdallarchaeota archaeon]